jgi:hypothetical protein
VLCRIVSTRKSRRALPRGRDHGPREPLSHPRPQGGRLAGNGIIGPAASATRPLSGAFAARRRRGLFGERGAASQRRRSLSETPPFCWLLAGCRAASGARRTSSCTQPGRRVPERHGGARLGELALELALDMFCPKPRPVYRASAHPQQSLARRAASPGRQGTSIAADRLREMEKLELPL